MKRGWNWPKHQVTTIFNPAPAVEFPDSVYPLCDYLLPMKPRPPIWQVFR